MYARVWVIKYVCKDRRLHVSECTVVSVCMCMWLCAFQCPNECLRVFYVCRLIGVDV